MYIHEAFHPDAQRATAALSGYKADCVAFDALQAWTDKPAQCEQVCRIFHLIIMKWLCLDMCFFLGNKPTNYKVAGANLKDVLLSTS